MYASISLLTHAAALVPASFTGLGARPCLTFAYHAARVSEVRLSTEEIRSSLNSLMRQFLSGIKKAGALAGVRLDAIQNPFVVGAETWV